MVCLSFRLFLLQLWTDFGKLWTHQRGPTYSVFSLRMRLPSHGWNYSVLTYKLFVLLRCTWKYVFTDAHYIGAYAVFTFLLWGVRRASLIKYLVVIVMCTTAVRVVSYGQGSLYSTIVFFCTTPRRGGIGFGTATIFLRAEQAVPPRRSRNFKAHNGRPWGCQRKYSFWRPRRGKPNEAY